MTFNIQTKQQTKINLTSPERVSLLQEPYTLIQQIHFLNYRKMAFIVIFILSVVNTLLIWNKDIVENKSIPPKPYVFS